MNKRKRKIVFAIQLLVTLATIATLSGIQYPVEAGWKYCQEHRKDPICQILTVTPEVKETEEHPPKESTPTDVPSATPITSETPVKPAPTQGSTETPTTEPSATPGDPATPTPSSTPTTMPTDTPTSTLEPSASPTPTSTEVVPTEEEIPTDCFSGRRSSGEGERIGFCAGEEVFGGSIGLDDGRTCEGGGCWLPIAPTDGWVSSGTVTPWLGEVSLSLDPWIEPVCSGRRPTGEGRTGWFCAGEEVFGVDILLKDGNSCSGGSYWLPSAPLGGWVQTGTVEPWDGEVPDGTEPWYPYGPPPTETPTPSPTPAQSPEDNEETQQSPQSEVAVVQDLGTVSPDGWYQVVSQDGQVLVKDGSGRESAIGEGRSAIYLRDWTILIAREDGSLYLTDRLATFEREIGASGQVLGISTNGEWVKVSNDGHPTVVSVHGARYGLGSADAQAFAHIVFPDHASGP